MAAPELVAELEEQLDCEPPPLVDTVDSPTVVDALADDLGASTVPLAIAACPGLVDALELEEQLPELPLTLDGELLLSVLEELLQLNALASFGVVGITLKNTLAAQTDIANVIANLFM